jgi:hypothetical protein
MEEYYGGGIPFSAVLKDSRKTNKRKKQRTKKRKSRMKSKSKENNCKCKIDKRSNTPEGLGFCPKCSPLNIMIRGKDKKLYEIKKNKSGENFWENVN